MKRTITRNIAIISAIFIITFAVMLITNYFQVRGATPLQTEVIETLKQINDQNTNNPVLQEQIRRLDLLARNAYFVRMDHLTSGVYILLAMLAVFIICARLYFAHSKDIPDKEIDPVDEWLIKTRARRYVTWAASVVAATAFLFALLSSPYLRTVQPNDAEPNSAIAQVTDAEQPIQLPNADDASTDTTISEPASTETVVQALSTTVETVTDSVATATESTTIAAAPTVAHAAFRGNSGNGISPAKNVPVEWDLAAGANIAWRQPIPRKGFNSPVIHGNRVFFSGADEQARELFCYDLNTGAQLWKLAAANIAGSPQQMPAATEDTGIAASSVATDGKQVCAIFATGDIICASADGSQLWAKNIGVPDNHYGYASSLLIYGNTVIVQYDNANDSRVMALDLATGAERWNRSRQEKITWSSPIIANVNNTQQLVLMGNPAITAYNPANGEQLWRTECMSGEVGASACSANGVIFGASEYATLVAINGADGSTLWEAVDFLPEVSSPVATKDNLYLATSYGVVASYNAETGELRKEHELNTEFYSSPIIAEGRLYLFSNDGKMHIFTADNEFRLLNSFETGERTFATPAFTDGRIVVRTEESIYCVAAK